MHHRLVPKEHRFSYKFFSFYLDLDEIDELTSKIPFLSHNQVNAYSLYDIDHLVKGQHSIKDNILSYLQGRGINLQGGRIMLLTYLRTFGYVFNPVSLYYCFDKDNNPLCVVPEIGNTFGELKLFFIGTEGFSGNKFKDRQDKFYYISPFTKLDDTLDFRLTVPDNRVNIGIDTSKNGEKIILTTMIGEKKELTNGNLLWLTIKFPFVTLKVIALIHWHAFMLWLKRIPHEEKTSNPHLQKEVRRAWNKGSKNTATVSN
jgi:DUF1365 family protein